MGKNAKDMMDVCSEVVDEKTVEELKKVGKLKHQASTLKQLIHDSLNFIQKQAEKLIVSEFITEKKHEIDQAKAKKKSGKTMKVVNANTGETFDNSAI